MDVLNNLKSMSAGQFCSLQIFEIVYLVVLAVLPFIVAFREITYAILSILTVVVIVAVFRKCTLHIVDSADKTVLITGCDSGFGNACARQLVSRGFTVVAGCYNIDSEGARGLKDSGTANLHIVKLDITNEESIQQVILKLNNLSQGKGLWALVNNAGVSGFGNVEFLSLDTYKKIMNVNVIGTLRITKVCLPLIRVAKGRVIMMSGTTGKLSLPGQSATCISNFGLEAFSDALRLELQPFDVKVITVRPGNFAGATGLLNKSGLEKLRSLFDSMKQTVDKDILTAYGQNYVNNQYDQVVGLSKSTASSLINVVDAMESAVRSKKPKSQVLVDGGNQLLDLGNILVHLHPFLPSSLFDFLVSRFYNTKIDNISN